MGQPKKYAVKEIFATLQGEGSRAGARSVFLRLAGCNLWDGRPEHRERGRGDCSAWCDTDFVGGRKLSSVEILKELNLAWGRGSGPWVVISGGEPCLQLDEALVVALHDNGWKVAVETNGTIANPALAMADHVTVSPKRGGELVVTVGTELKVVLPGGRNVTNLGAGWHDRELETLARLTSFEFYYVQPQDPIDSTLVQVSHLHKNIEGDAIAVASAGYARNLRRCVQFVESHPGWRLSLQTHKYIDLP
jgi:7-carboxy-7-deazaguanine synthase